MRATVVAVLAWIWAALIYISVALTLAFGLVEFDPVGALIGPLLASLGALLATLRPRNPIGLLMLLMATGYGVAVDDVVIAVAQTSWGTGPGWVALLFATNLFTTLYILPPMFLLLLFPTGRPPAGGWRWLLRAALGFTAAWIVATLLVPSWVSLDDRFAVDNPLVPYSEADLGPAVERFFEIGFTGFLVVLLLLSVVSLIVRYRRAGAVERAQIRWLLYSAFLFAVSFALLTLTSGFQGETPLLGAIFYLSVLAIPVSIAIAILRHRLFDIDVIIRRTLQYGVLTATLVGLYFGSVLLAQNLLGGLIGRADSPPVVIVTTLILAALFNPLRLRVQRFIDRCFYRSKVDAERALARFASLARDEVDLDQLRSALFGAVGETLQPERMGLWLRPERGARDHVTGESP